MPTSRITIGRREEATHPDALRAAAAEFFSTLIFVFAGQGSGVAFSKLTGNAATTPVGLVAAALAHGFALPCQPRRHLRRLPGGNITLFRGLLYWVAQLLGSIVACLLLLFVTGSSTGTFELSGVGVWNAVVLEIVLTFGLVYTVYATAVDPKKDSVGIIGPLAIGLVVGANILVGGAFDGAAMNPAIAFGPALVSWSWTNHWVYWAGPLIGGGVAGILYELLFIFHTHEELPTTDY
ncbi:unnamed protein product [Spirodela intermedia]|uniref:Uncharacterized protein n=1 Tax=Spirodela intermedia TaxID=51605 RepID=A0A7I8JT81_SPIIN|nr:unnamed protein product [Spirodela intermedia]CAA6673319.1 unnamed protein product [Spirodela intermedia]